MVGAPMTVVETAEFLKHATELMPDSDRDDLVAFVGANPEAGEIIPGDRRCEEDSLGSGRHGKAWRRTGHLLLPQRAVARVPAVCVCEEPQGESQQG